MCRSSCHRLNGCCFQTSCSLTYKSYSTGYHPFELVVEDFPKSPISLSYSDGSYTNKHPHSVQRKKRQISSNATATSTPRVYRNTIPALSRLPLQFSIHGLFRPKFEPCLSAGVKLFSAVSFPVDSFYAPSCVDGLYFPIFLAPTPVDGVTLPAFVNHTLKIMVRSRAQNTR